MRDIDQDMTAGERIMEENRELRELVDEMNGSMCPWITRQCRSLHGK